MRTLQELCVFQVCGQRNEVKWFVEALQKNVNEAPLSLEPSAHRRLLFYLLVPGEHKFQTLTVKKNKVGCTPSFLFSAGNGVHGLVFWVTEREAGWMCGLAEGPHRHERRQTGGVWRPCRLTWASSSPERSRSGAAWPSLPGKRTKGRRFDTSAAPNWTRHRTRRPQRQRRG